MINNKIMILFSKKKFNKNLTKNFTLCNTHIYLNNKKMFKFIFYFLFFLKINFYLTYLNILNKKSFQSLSFFKNYFNYKTINFYNYFFNFSLKKIKKYKNNKIFKKLWSPFLFNLIGCKNKIKIFNIYLYKNFYIFKSTPHLNYSIFYKNLFFKNSYYNIFKFFFINFFKNIKNSNFFKKIYSNNIKTKKNVISNINNKSYNIIFKKHSFKKFTLITLITNASSYKFKHLFFKKFIINFSHAQINFNKFLKNNNNKKSLNLPFKKYLINFNQINNFYNLYLNKTVIYKNIFLYNMHNFIIPGNSGNYVNKLKNQNYFNNYYPLTLCNKSALQLFFKKFSFKINANYSVFISVVFINFIENFFKKKVFFKISNNNFNKIKNSYFYSLYNNYKNYKPIFFKKFYIYDFIEIIWYSFYFKDLNMISNWISRAMESMNFKYHRKFLLFLTNFINKNSSLFIDVLKIKGFFFDIRGKVGVTGSSKKRHMFFKIGSLSKSTKKNKIDFNQNIVRTYSGVMGVTYILNY